MTTRVEFLELVQDHAIHGEEYTEIKILNEWDQQAAELERLQSAVNEWRAEVERLRAELTDVPLTVENAPLARVVEMGDDCTLWERCIDEKWTNAGVPYYETTADILSRGATVLAWVKS